MRRFLFLIALALPLAACTPSAPPTVTTAPAATSKPAKVDLTIPLFTDAPIPLIKIHIYPNNEQLLRTEPRNYVGCTFTETPAPTLATTATSTAATSTAPATAPATTSAPAPLEHNNVQIKLKGSIGSFREYTDRPALSLKMKETNERFHGLAKFHLNNSVQDDTYLNEFLGSLIFRAANYPAARVTHARVLINDRDLGFYVLMEGLDKHLLKRFFPENDGNLYESLSKRDIDAPLPLNSGKGVDDSSDLKALVDACREPDLEKRYALIAQRLDVDLFLTFTALETMLVHWDGYNLNANNYRLYFRPSDNRAVFIPHGMDQLFRDPSAPVLSTPPSIVGKAVLSNPKWNAQYVQRVRDLLPLLAPEKLFPAIDAAQARIHSVLAGISPSRAQQYDYRVAALKSRLAQRPSRILAQLPPIPTTTAPATTTAPK